MILKQPKTEKQKDLEKEAISKIVDEVIAKKALYLKEKEKIRVRLLGWLIFAEMRGYQSTEVQRFVGSGLKITEDWMRESREMFFIKEPYKSIYEDALGKVKRKFPNW